MQRPVNVLSVEESRVESSGLLDKQPTLSEMHLIAARLGASTDQEKLGFGHICDFQTHLGLLIRWSRTVGGEVSEAHLLYMAEKLIELRKAFVKRVASLIEAKGKLPSDITSDALREAHEWAMLYELWDEHSIISRKRYP